MPSSTSNNGEAWRYGGRTEPLLGISKVSTGTIGGICIIDDLTPTRAVVKRLVYFSPRMNGKMPPWNRGYSMRPLRTAQELPSGRWAKGNRSWLCLQVPGQLFRLNGKYLPGLTGMSNLPRVGWWSDTTIDAPGSPVLRSQTFRWNQTCVTWRQ